MEDFREFITWVLMGLVGLLGTIGGWVFGRIFRKLDELESNQRKMEQELLINNERDAARDEKLTEILSIQKEIHEELKNYNQAITDLYLNNPDIKRPGK